MFENIPQKSLIFIIAKKSFVLIFERLAKGDVPARLSTDRLRVTYRHDSALHGFDEMRLL